jgi:hypothetical protein
MPFTPCPEGLKRFPIGLLSGGKQRSSAGSAPLGCVGRGRAEVLYPKPIGLGAHTPGLLEQPEGASVVEIGQRLGWLPHIVCAAITGLRQIV